MIFRKTPRNDSAEQEKGSRNARAPFTLIKYKPGQSSSCWSGAQDYELPPSCFPLSFTRRFLFLFINTEHLQTQNQHTRMDVVDETGNNER